VAGKTAVNAKNLEALGADRLAHLLVEISTGNAAIKRRLRLELAAAKSPGDVAKEVRKRLTTIARSRSFVDWQGIRLLADDLDTQRRAIVEAVANANPAEALDLLWRFMALALTVFDRCDDSRGTVIGVFHQACRDLGEVASSTGAHPITLADRDSARLRGATRKPSERAGRYCRRLPQTDHHQAATGRRLGGVVLSFPARDLVALGERGERVAHAHLTGLIAF
jgi:hypothetical protein